MAAFVAIADSGSLTAAGQKLGKSQPAMVRNLARLEQEVGARLMRRTTRRIALTTEGREYLARCRQILADVQEAEEAIGLSDAVPAGELRITAPVTFGQWHVAPALLTLVQSFPRIKVELVQLDRPVNLVEEGLDLAVRIGHLPDSSMIATQVGWMRRVVVASPKLLDKVGLPCDPQALQFQPCIRFRGLSARDWRFQRDGRDITVPVDGPFISNQAVSAVEACTAGLGFGQFLSYQVEPSVTRGELRLLLRDFEVAPVPVNLVYSEARLMSPRLRACLDHLRGSLSDSLKRVAVAVS